MPPNMGADPAFKNMSSNMTGFHVWRIENMLVVPIPSEAWGKFYSGDAYITLSSAPYGNRYIHSFNPPPSPKSQTSPILSIEVTP